MGGYLIARETRFSGPWLRFGRREERGDLRQSNGLHGEAFARGYGASNFDAERSCLPLRAAGNGRTGSVDLYLRPSIGLGDSDSDGVELQRQSNESSGGVADRTIVLWSTGSGPTGSRPATSKIRFGNRQAQRNYAAVTAAGLCHSSLKVASVGGVRTSSITRA